MSTPSCQITFAITSGVEYRKQTKMLIDSIRNHMPDSNIVLFVPNKAYDFFEDEYLEFLQEETDVYHGSIPRPEYPLTALTKSFIIAAENYETKYFVQLDSDTLLLNRFRLPKTPESSVLAKPTNLGSHYWASEDSLDQWRKIYNHFDAAVPSQRIYGTFDRKKGFPVWNGGVIATTDSAFPRRWLETTEEILESGILGSRFFYAEQVSLSVLGTLEYRISPLSIKQNYAQEYVIVPDDVQVFHYGNPNFLPFYLATPDTYSKLRSHWSGNYSPSIGALLERCMSVIRGRGRRYIPRTHRLQAEKLGASALGLFPGIIEDKFRLMYGGGDASIKHRDQNG